MISASSSRILWADACCIRDHCRRKVIELESYYRKIEEIEAAKMFIFQKFRRYTSSDIFYTGVSAEEARNFKQAVALVEQQNVE